MAHFHQVDAFYDRWRGDDCPGGLDGRTGENGGDDEGYGAKAHEDHGAIARVFEAFGGGEAGEENEDGDFCEG